MLKADVRSAQEMFEALGYKKEKEPYPDIQTYTDNYRTLLITKSGAITIGNLKNTTVVSLSTEEIEAIYKQIKELKRC